MILRNDFKGAKAWILPIAAMRSRMEDRDSGVKVSELLRLVKRRVFEGGVGVEIGGREERSRVRPADLRELAEEEREARGVISSRESILKMVMAKGIGWCGCGVVEVEGGGCSSEYCLSLVTSDKYSFALVNEFYFSEA